MCCFTVIDRHGNDLMRRVRCREDEAAGPGAPPTKTIVFSTFTRALDLLQQRLMPSSIGFLRLDGSMRLSQRTDAIRAFARDPQVPCQQGTLHLHTACLS